MVTEAKKIKRKFAIERAKLVTLFPLAYYGTLGSARLGLTLKDLKKKEKKELNKLLKRVEKRKVKGIDAKRVKKEDIMFIKGRVKRLSAKKEFG